MIDYNNMLYEDYKKLLDDIEKYNKHFLSKPPLKEIRLRHIVGNIGRKDLDIKTANHEQSLYLNFLTKTIRISNLPPTEIKKDVISDLAFLDSEEMADYIYNKEFNDTPKEYISEVKKAILEEIEDMKSNEHTKYFKLNK